MIMIVAASTTAFAQTVPMTDRPLVIPAGQGNLSFDMTVGLNEGALGRTGGIYSDLLQDPRGGLEVSYGFAKRIEAGISMPWLFCDMRSDLVQAYNTAMAGWPMFLNTNNRSHFQPISIWARFKLADFVAADIAVMIPLENTKANQMGASVAVPFKFTVIPHRLAVHFRPEAKFGFASSSRAFGEYVQISLFMDAGLTANITPQLFMDFSLGYGHMVLPGPGRMVASDYMGTTGYSGSGWLPISFTIGYTVIPSIDLFAGFSMTNLAPAAPISAADGRSLTIGLDYRF